MSFVENLVKDGSHIRFTNTSGIRVPTVLSIMVSNLNRLMFMQSREVDPITFKPEARFQPPEKLRWNDTRAAAVWVVLS